MNQDLKSRIPAGVLYVIIIAGATLCGTVTTMVLLYVFAILCIHEYIQSASNHAAGTSVYALGMALLGLTLPFVIEAEHIFWPILLFTSIALLSLNAVYLLITKKTFYVRSPVILMSMSYVVIPFILAVSCTLKFIEFPKIILGTFIILWLNDAGAYFSGKALGKTKLAPSISPNKTWEGLIGGGILGVGITYAIAHLIGGMILRDWILLSMIIWITGSLGDLVESSWKRLLGIKDSGTLMAGHGGFLDRLDSFIYAIPFVSLYYEMTQ